MIIFFTVAPGTATLGTVTLAVAALHTTRGCKVTITLVRDDARVVHVRGAPALV